MKIIGLTGGIGSGKTTVAKMFKQLGVPVYIADKEAKTLMRKSKVIKRKLIELFGEEAYINNELNKPFIANIIFNDNAVLNRMNAIIHPRVARHFTKWMEKQTVPVVIKESAILFEKELYKQCDFVITVTVPKSVRIERLLKRDNTTVEKIEAIIKNQWSDKEKIARSDYVIVNLELKKTKNQVAKIYRQIMNSL